jgi:protein gp37
VRHEGVGEAIDWLIIGGESGGPPERALVEKRCLGCGKEGYAPHREQREWLPKPEALKWVRSLRDQCLTAGVPFFFKAWGGPTSKSGGRILDGKTWDEFPHA